MKRSWFAAVVVAFVLVAGPARASGDGFAVPFALDPYGGAAAEQDAYYADGQLGVVMARAPWSRLFAAWRILHELPVGKDVGRALALPCCDAKTDDVGTDWVAARSAVPGAGNVQITVFRELPDFVSLQTCFPDAFATAAKTLGERIAAYGATDPSVRLWLDGQDAVFASCAENLPMPKLPSDAPPWLVKDRAYQTAAQALYERRFADAEAGFAAIAEDADSPWRQLAPYLAARAAVRVAIAGKDAPTVAEARTRLAALDAPDAFGHGQREALGGMLDFRARPDERRAELARILTGPTLPATAAADFKDARRLGQQPPGEPAFLDWISVVGRPSKKPQAFWMDHYDADDPWKTDAAALAHARERWTATSDTAWLLAAMMWTDPGPDAADLVAASRKVAAADPGWLTAAYHRIRLTYRSDPAAARAELDGLLPRTTSFPSSRNLFVAERSLVATDLADFLRFARRDAPCDYDVNPTPTSAAAACVGYKFGFEQYEQAAPEGRFGADALATIDRMTLAQRADLAQAESLSPELRLDLLLTTWTRAALAGNTGMADRLASDLLTSLPQMAPELRTYLAAQAGPDKRFSAWFFLAKLPGAAVDLGGDTYTRPVGEVKDFEGHWPDWRFVGHGSPAASDPQLVPIEDFVCFGLCGQGAFPYAAPPFVAANATRADDERGHYDPPEGAAGTGFVWEELLAYVQAHPTDPRSPEALYWLNRVSRFGKGHARSSFRAFTLLHRRFPNTSWAKDSKYFYD